MLTFCGHQVTASAAARFVAPIIFVMVAVLWPYSLYAGVIHVDGTNCTLPKAITAANTDSDFDGCEHTGDAGADTILITGTHSIDTFEPIGNQGATANPSITTKITISGGTTGAIVERPPAPPFYRLFHISASGELTLENITVRYGNFDGHGGAIYNLGRLILRNSEIRENTGWRGGAISNVGGELIIENSRFISNTAGPGGTSHNGGAIYIPSGTLSLLNSHILSNTAVESGGGIYIGGGTAVITNSVIAHNSTQASGGGIVVDDAVVTVSGGEVRDNSALNSGGGANVQDQASAFFHGTVFSGNQAAKGGGLSVDDAAELTLTDSEVSDNGAITDGGGIYVNSATVNVQGAKITANQAGVTGGGIYQISGTTTVAQSCIVHNSDTAVVHDGGNPINAADNWWGAPDGPSGAGPGAGDSISANVLFDPPLATAPDDCPTFSAEVAFGKAASPASPLLPGQPLTYTLTITNLTAEPVNNLYVSESHPAGYLLDEVSFSRPGINPTSSGYVIAQLAGLETVVITLRGHVDPTLTSNLTLSNTATLTNALVGTLNATVERTVVVPTLNWSQQSFEAVESSGVASPTLTLDPANPYAPVQVQVVYTDSAQTGMVAAAILSVTIPANSSSHQVAIPLANDEQLQPRTISMQLQSPSGAQLGPNSQATISVRDADAAPAIAISVQPSVLEATVGETITYTYRITNTGNVTLTTISANDDRFGAITGLAGALAPSGTRNAFVTYTVQEDDLPGPLQNSVVVNATDLFGTNVSENASASVTLRETGTSSRQLHLPRLGKE